MRHPANPVSLNTDPRIIAPDGQSKRMQICVPITGLRRNGHATAALDHQLVYGQRFDVYKSKGRFAWGQEVTKSGQGYVGYVALSALQDRASEPTHRTTALKTPVFSKPDLKSFIRRLLPLNAHVMVQESTGDYHRIEGGYIHQHHVCGFAAKGGDHVNVAERHMGLPYIWGGVGPDGLDCSGLVQASLRAVGRDCLRDAYMQEQTLGRSVDNHTNLKRGDLVFWRGHVGIMRDADILLHANGHHMLVVSEPLDEAAERIKNAAGPITAIRRL